MAASNVILYRANLDDLRLQDLPGATVKLHLLTSAYTPDATTTGNSVLADIVANEISGGGYSGGITLTGVAVAAVTNGWNLTSNNVTVAASGGTLPAWRYGVLAVSGALWGKTSPILGYFLGDNTPADIAAINDGSSYPVNAPAGGWFQTTHA